MKTDSSTTRVLPMCSGFAPFANRSQPKTRSPLVTYPRVRFDVPLEEDPALEHAQQVGPSQPPAEQAQRGLGFQRFEQDVQRLEKAIVAERSPVPPIDTEASSSLREQRITAQGLTGPAKAGRKWKSPCRSGFR